MADKEPTHGTFDVTLPDTAQRTGVECDLCGDEYKDVGQTYVCPSCLFMPDVTYEQRTHTDRWERFCEYRTERAERDGERLRAVGGFPRAYTYD